MHTTRLALTILTLAAVLSACSGIRVRSDFDSRTDFSAYRTYAWLTKRPPSQPARAPEVSDILMERIQRAVAGELAGKGLRRVKEEAASLLVTHHVSIEEKLQFTDPYFAYDRVKTYEEGTLLIDFIDAKTQQLVWRGSGQTKLREAPTPEERDQRVKEVVDAILAQYPPKKK
jgi:hypothetical protein